jgi:hypothetical protein
MVMDDFFPAKIHFFSIWSKHVETQNFASLPKSFKTKKGGQAPTFFQP